MDEAGINSMDPESLSSLTLTEADLMNLQQSGPLGANSSSHFTQNDLDTLASIQDDLETFNMNSHNQEEIADMAALGKEMEGFMQNQINMSDEQIPNYPMEMNLNPSSSLPSSQESSTTTESSSSISEANPLQGITLETGKSSNLPVNSQSTTNAEAASVSLPSSTSTSSQAKSIQIIKAGTGFSKLKLAKQGNTGGVQQIRIQSASAKPTVPVSIQPSPQIQQKKPIEILSNKTKQLQGQVVNIVNSDGSLQTVNLVTPVVQQPLATSSGPVPGSITQGGVQLQGGQTIQIMTGQNAPAGSLKLISPGSAAGGGQVQLVPRPKITLPPNQLIQVANPGSTDDSKVAVPSGQGIKVIGAGGQIFRLLGDGKLMVDSGVSTLNPQTAQKPTAQQVLPTQTLNTAPAIKTIKPEQGQLFRTADKKLIAFTGDKNVIVSGGSATGTPSSQEKGPQIIQLSSDDLKVLQKGPNQYQFVKVVNAAGQAQTIPVQINNAKARFGSPVKMSTSTPPPATAVSHDSSLDSAIRELQQMKRDQQHGGLDSASSSYRVKKPCNCTKSQCLKLYCDCFAVGEFCSDCNCTNCHNNLEHEEERQRSIRQCLDRNPNAFRPKIGKNPSQKDRRHNKGCNCKRSGCLKNYCECFEAKIICTDICKCVGCKNLDERTGTKLTSLHFVEAMPDESLAISEKNFKPTTSLRSKLLQATPILKLEEQTNVKRQPFGFLTQEVVEATCQCLLAQAEQAEKQQLPQEAIERQVIQEFGRCLGQIIDFASKTKA